MKTAFIILCVILLILLDSFVLERYDDRKKDKDVKK